MISILALGDYDETYGELGGCVVHMTDCICQHTGINKLEDLKEKKISYCLWFKYYILYMEQVRHEIPVQVSFTSRPAELHIFHSTREQRHFQNICGSVEGQNADTRLQDEWF